jgi:simple sugar transport system permease protein
VLLLASLAGIAGGAAWAGITALLRDRFNANEILVSLMLTYIAQLLLMYAVNGPLKDPNGMNFPQSKVFLQNSVAASVQRQPSAYGFLVMLLASGAMAYLSIAALPVSPDRRWLAPLAARYAGFSSRRLYGLRC